MAKRIDKITRKKWIKNKSDELAAEAGAFMDEAKGQFVCDWLERVVVLYEGFAADKPLSLLPWHRDAIMRLFGWQMFSEKVGKPIRRFQKASIWCAKKNAKTPFLAMLEIFCASGENEPGNHCFSVALDGEQAKLAHVHTVKIVENSPQLWDKHPDGHGIFNVNRSTLQITDNKTGSTIEILKGGKNKTAQHGKNGYLFVDEVHSVDGELMNILKYAGISRREPLHVEVSTAGNNPDSYGFRRYKYAKDVEAGKEIDHRLLVIDYSAPQDVTNEQLDADIEKYGKMANPAWGFLVDPQEFKSDYHESKRSISDFNTFKYQRLNIWQRSSNPWLKESDWDKSIVEKTPRQIVRELGHIDAYGGLDVSQSHDMTSFTLDFPKSDGKHSMITWLWMPRATAEFYDDKAEFLKWGSDGFIKLTDGNTMDYNIVLNDICRLGRIFKILEVGYDKMYADFLMQQISRGYVNSEGKTIASGIGCRRIEFMQTIPSLAKPTTDFEKALRDGQLEIIKNNCLTWQAGHVEVYRDGSGNMKPEKPVDTPYKKIDGIMTSIFAYARGAMKRPKPSVSFISCR